MLECLLIVFPELLLGGHVFGLIEGRVGELGKAVGALLHDIVDHVLVLEEIGQDDALVDDGRALHGRHAPQEEGALDQPVEGDPADEELGEEFTDGEGGEDDPVHEPLRVVVLGRALQGLDGAVSRVDEADEVADELGAVAEHQPEGQEGHDA